MILFADDTTMIAFSAQLLQWIS